MLDTGSLPVIPWKGDVGIESLPAAALRGADVASKDADVWSPASHTQPSPAISYQGFGNSRLRNRRVTAPLCLSQKKRTPRTLAQHLSINSTMKNTTSLRKRYHV